MDKMENKNFKPWNKGAVLDPGNFKKQTFEG